MSDRIEDFLPNHIEACPDHDYWSKAAYWTAAEAAALTLDINPNAIVHLSGEAGHFYGLYWGRLDLIDRAIKMEALSEDIEPTKFLKWAKANDIGLSRDLEEKILSRSKGSSAPHELHPKERSTALKLILGMAIDGYGYDPKASRSSVSREIAEALSARGFGIDDGTVRKFLQLAKDQENADLTEK